MPPRKRVHRPSSPLTKRPRARLPTRPSSGAFHPTELNLIVEHNRGLIAHQLLRNKNVLRVLSHADVDSLALEAIWNVARTYHQKHALLSPKQLRENRYRLGLEFANTCQTAMRNAWMVEINARLSKKRGGKIKHVSLNAPVRSRRGRLLERRGRQTVLGDRLMIAERPSNLDRDAMIARMDSVLRRRRISDQSIRLFFEYLEDPEHTTMQSLVTKYNLARSRPGQIIALCRACLQNARLEFTAWD